MNINIYKDQMQRAYIFDAPVLYSSRIIPQVDVPQDWYYYDLCGTDEEPDRPSLLVDQSEKNRIGSILSYLPLKSVHSESRLVTDMFHMTGVSVSLSRFCSGENIKCPEPPLQQILRPASPEDAELFYTYETCEKYQELGTIGQLRFDFGYAPGHLCRSWWYKTGKDMSTPEFKEELEKVVASLRRGVLKSLDHMKRWCERYDCTLKDGKVQDYGFTVETERYRYCLRCSPANKGDQAYLTCFDKQIQQMALAERDQPREEQGMQML